MWVIETATGISITPNSLEAYRRLPSEQNDQLIIKFSRIKDPEMVLTKEAKLRVSILTAFVLKELKSLSMKVFVATITSYGVNTKPYDQRNELKLSGLAMTKSKSELKLKVQFLELLQSAELINKLWYSVK